MGAQRLGLGYFIQEAAVTFDDFWPTGPWRKLGRKAAQRHWNTTVKTDEDLINIQQARDNYIVDQKANKWRKPQHGSTWFNNWTEWLNEDYDGNDMVDTPKDHTHFCENCRPAHDWTCQLQEECRCADVFTCPAWAQRELARLQAERLVRR